MSTIAITIWEDRISPVFDTASTFLFCNGTTEIERINISNLNQREKSRILEEHNCSTLICGAISEDAMIYLSDAGIQVISWTRGKITNVLEAVLNNTLMNECFCMPGCRGRRHGRGRMRRRHGDRTRHKLRRNNIR